MLSTALLILAFRMPMQARPRHAGPRESSGNEAQVVAGPIAEKVTSTSAVVWWQTTAPIQTILLFGTAPQDLHQRVQRPWSTTTHEISLKKLQPGTTYYLAVLQPDGAKAGESQFTTEPVGYAQQDNVRITNGPLFEQIKPDSAVIAWSTNVPSSSTVRYGTDAHNLDKKEKAPWAPMTHRVVLRDLRPDTHYFFTIESSQQTEGAPEPSTSQNTAEPTPPSPPNFPPPQIYAFRTLAQGQQAVNIGPSR